ncbi:hypothetical protein FB451DRAFT_1284391 [Mycena latifolia]|nr:hypothetical protein FB451DRAFT_1284391 [Mycena latifolia]
MPFATFALTYGSFEDLLETARLVKRIIDVLRGGGCTAEREKTISILKSICDDMAKLSAIAALDSSTPEGLYFTDRLSSEVALCRSLMAQFYSQIHPSSSVLGRLWFAVSEERELSSWRAQISERRQALHLILSAFISVPSGEVGEQLHQIGSQVQDIAPRIKGVEEQVQEVEAGVRNVGILGVIVSGYLATQSSRMGSEIRQVGTDIHQILQRISPHGILHPVFFVLDPLGRAITIQFAPCDGFNDLDRILKAHLHQRPQAGSRYVERGDYTIVTPDGTIILPWDFARNLGPGAQFNMSIVKFKRIRAELEPTPRICPYCNHRNSDGEEGGWILCSNLKCGRKCRMSLEAVVPEIESVFESPETAEEDRAKLLRLIQIIYLNVRSTAVNIDQFDKTFPPDTRVFYWNSGGQAVYGTVEASEKINGQKILTVRPDRGDLIRLPALSVNRVG